MPRSSTSWRPGHPKSPKAGRKKGVLNKATFEIKAACQAVGPLVIERLTRLSMTSLDGATATRAASILLAYGYGKPTERVEVTGADGGAIQVQAVGQASEQFKGRFLRLVKGGPDVSRNGEPEDGVVAGGATRTVAS